MSEYQAGRETANKIEDALAAAPAQGSAGWSTNDPKLIEAALALAVDFFNTHHDWPEITKRMPEALARFRALAPP